MSYEQILNEEESSRKNRLKKDKIKLSNNYRKKERLQEIKLPQPIIYEPSENNHNKKGNLSLTTSDDDHNQDQRRRTPIPITDAKEIIDYYFTFHKNMINSYNSLYSKMLQDISNSYNDGFSTVNKRFTGYSFEIENMYNSLTNQGDKSLKLVDKIITENLDTYIKSIKQAQKFYKDVTESYLNLIRKK
jgi:hypothetical protein